MAKEQHFWMQVADEVEGYSVIIDDDGTVAYAYLLGSCQKIVSDVWLYNHGPTPVSVDRSDRDALPFRNPEGFASAIVIEPLQKTSDILIEWKRSLRTSIDHCSLGTLARKILLWAQQFSRHKTDLVKANS